MALELFIPAFNVFIPFYLFSKFIIVSNLYSIKSLKKPFDYKN